MAINIKNLEELIQKKAYAVTSSTPTSDLGDIVEASLLATNSLREYDSAGLLPAATSNEKIAFVQSDKSVRFNNGQKWDTLTSGAAQASPTAPTVPVYAGTEYGYAFNAPPNVDTDTFDRYPFASDADATNLGTSVGTPTLRRTQMGGGGGNTKGFHAGGFNTSSPTSPGQAATYIASFPYASGTPLTDTSYSLSLSRRYIQNEMVGDRTYAYYLGGQGNLSPTGLVNTIDKHPETVDANATDVGDLLSVQYYGSATSSPTHGYVAGGFTPSASNVIQKVSFSSDGNSTDVGDLIATTAYGSGAASSTHGYNNGAGYPANSNIIQKYPFAADGDATDTADLLAAKSGAGGATSSTHAYLAGGAAPGTTDQIEKFSFAVETDASDVGNLSKARAYDISTTHN